jgi:predicted permease
MTEIFLVILPLVLLVALGQVIAKTGWLALNDWTGLEKLSFRILIPALIIRSIAHSDMTLKSSGLYVVTMLVAFTVAGMLTLLLRMALPKTAIGNPQLSSMFQAVTRWNALITLPVAAQLFGPAGLTTISIAMAFLIPFINIVNIAALATLLAGQFSVGNVLKAIALNPLIIASVIGLLLNISNIPIPAPIDTTLEMTARAALAVGLLCVGAGFNMRRLFHLNWQIVWAVALKSVLAPALVMALAQFFGLGQMEILCAMLVVATPTATNGYIIARQMGGDAELYAIILNWQLVVAIIAFPVMIAIMQG